MRREGSLVGGGDGRAPSRGRAAGRGLAAARALRAVAARGGLALGLGLALAGCALLRSCSRGDLTPANDQVARYHQQGMQALANDQPAQAVEAFELALRLQPLFVPSKAHLGHARYKLKQYDRAEQELLDTIETHPDYADSYNYLGMVYEARGDKKRAEELYGQAIDTYPGYADAHFNRAELYAKQDRREDALRDYLAAGAAAAGGKDESSKRMAARAHAAAGLIYVRNGLKQDAKQNFQIAIDFGVPIPEARFGLGRMFALDELWVEAILEFHEALIEPEKEWTRKSDVDLCKKALAEAEKRSPKHIAQKIVDHAKKEHDRLEGLSDAERDKVVKRAYDAMMRWLGSAAKIDPQLIDVKILEARCRFEKGEIEDAGKTVVAALKIDPKNKDARFMLASVYMARAQKRQREKIAGAEQDWPKAERILRELRREEPSVFKYHLALGRVYLQLEELRRAEREFREALQCECTEAQKERVGKELQILVNKPVIKQANELNDAAVKALEAKDFPRARDLLRQAISYDSQFAVAHANHALTELEAGNAPLALSMIQKAIDVDPDLHTAHMIKGRIHRMQRDYANARKELEEARRLNAYDPEAHYQLALLAYDERKPDEAEKACGRAIALNPKHFPSDVLVARIAWEKKLYDKAETYLLRAAGNSDNSYAPVFSALGELYLAMKRYDDARQAAERAYQLEPQAPEPWLILGESFEAEGKSQEALNAYATAAELFDASGRVDDAQKAAQRAVKLGPSNARALDALGLAVAKAGRLEEGVRHLRQALTHDPGYLKARFNLGTVYEAMKEVELAAEAYRACVKAIQGAPNPENREQVLAYVLPRLRLGNLCQPGRAGPVDRSEAIRVLHEAERAAPPDLKPLVRDKISELER